MLDRPWIHTRNNTSAAVPKTRRSIQTTATIRNVSPRPTLSSQPAVLIAPEALKQQWIREKQPVCWVDKKMSTWEASRGETRCTVEAFCLRFHLCFFESQLVKYWCFGMAVDPTNDPKVQVSRNLTMRFNNISNSTCKTWFVMQKHLGRCR